MTFQDFSSCYTNLPSSFKYNFIHLGTDLTTTTVVYDSAVCIRYLHTLLFQSMFFCAIRVCCGTKIYHILKRKKRSIYQNVFFRDGNYSIFRDALVHLNKYKNIGLILLVRSLYLYGSSYHLNALHFNNV